MSWVPQIRTEPFALYGLEELSDIRRSRINFPNLVKLVNFISRPEVMVNLPKPARSLILSSGESITMASVSRLHSFRHIFAMYKKDLEMKGIEECAAKGGDLQEYIKANSTVLPVRQVRMQCLDNFHADAIEAFESALTFVSELKCSGKLADNEAEDLHRRFRVAKNYLTGYFRLHLSVSSTCSTHCIRFALSDSSIPHFKSPCDHAHENSCEQCNDILTVFAQFREFLEVRATEAEQKRDDVAGFVNPFEKNHCQRIIVNESEKRVKEFQMHILRAASSELDRISIIDNLRDHVALITMDYSLKLLSTGFTKRDEKHIHHTLGHINDESKQDGVAVCVIGDHLFQVLSQNGITRVVLRSDNAANYKNAGTIYTLRITAAKYGVELDTYLFSEPQSGKGVADNRISHAKGKLRDVVNSGGNARDAEQILTSLTTQPLLKGLSFYNIKGNRVIRAERSKKAGEGIPNVTNLSSFHYEADGIRVKKFDSIGTGKVISYEQQEEIEFDYEILGQGGFLSMSPEFWGEIAEKTTKRKEKEQSNIESVEEDPEKKLFRCPDEMCSAKYLTSKGLSDHILIGKHKKREHSDTVEEAAAKLFSTTVETNEDAYLSMKIDAFSSAHSTIQAQKLTEGWAIQQKTKPTLMNPRVRAAVKEYFIERMSIQQSAEAKWVVKMLKNRKNPNGTYSFPIIACLKETQAQGLITRWLKLEATKGLKAVENEGKKGNIEEEGDDDAFCDDEEALECLDAEPPKKRGKSTTIMSEEKKKPTRKSTRSLSKKVTSKSEQKKQMQGDKSDGEESEEVNEPGTSTAKRRSTRSKQTTSGKPEYGKKTKADKPKNTTASTRVLRSGKRGSEVERKYYFENDGSEEEMDAFDAMMSAVHEKYHDQFTDSEEI